jgi:hypothetical protein
MIAIYTDLFYSLPLLSVSCSFSQFAAPSEKLNFSEIAHCSSGILETRFLWQRGHLGWYDVVRARLWSGPARSIGIESSCVGECGRLPPLFFFRGPVRVPWWWREVAKRPSRVVRRGAGPTLVRTSEPTLPQALELAPSSEHVLCDMIAYS